jgi:hypothetical protein
LLVFVNTFAAKRRGRNRLFANTFVAAVLANKDERLIIAVHRLAHIEEYLSSPQ